VSATNFEAHRPWITLTDAEVDWCKDIGAKRHQQARGANVQDRQMGPQDPMFIDINGLGGELAFCKACGVELVDALGVRSKGHDAFVCGLRFDVKTTCCTTGRLLVNRNKTVKDADCYALVRGTLPTYEIAGWCWAEDLIHDSNLGNLGHGLGYVTEARNLLPFGSLEERFLEPERWQKARGIGT
jgi:hypothetical protein